MHKFIEGPVLTNLHKFVMHIKISLYDLAMAETIRSINSQELLLLQLVPSVPLVQGGQGFQVRQGGLQVQHLQGCPGKKLNHSSVYIHEEFSTLSLSLSLSLSLPLISLPVFQALTSFPSPPSFPLGPRGPMSP